MTERQIVLNRNRTPDGTVLTSRHSHEYVSHTQADGYSYSVDGGTEGLYRSHTIDELSLYIIMHHTSKTGPEITRLIACIIRFFWV